MNKPDFGMWTIEKERNNKYLAISENGEKIEFKQHLDASNYILSQIRKLPFFRIDYKKNQRQQTVYTFYRYALTPEKAAEYTRRLVLAENGWKDIVILQVINLETGNE